jgi:hypothetical protein
MFQLWMVRRVRLEDALNLASELMDKAGYPPNTKKKGLVQCQANQSESTHACQISFQSFIGCLSKGCFSSGYIRVQACDCSHQWAFRKIINRFERELKERRWLDEEQLQLITI